MAKRPYIQHRYVVRNITNYPAPKHGNRVQVWSVCDKLMERVNADSVPSIMDVFLTREQARVAAKAMNNAWKSVLVNPARNINKKIRLVR